MLSIKDYARDNGVTYEAVRQQVKRYQKELEGHIHQEGRTQYLDDVAVAILNEHRSRNPIVLYNAEASDRANELERQLREQQQENKDLLTELKDAYKEIAGMKGLQGRLEEAESTRLSLEGKVADQAQELVLAHQDIQAAADREQAAIQHSRELEARVEALEAEQARPLTIMERLTGRRKGEA